MLSFNATLMKFGNKGEKTGWIYINIPSAIAMELKSNNKKSFRVKGKIDDVVIKSVALLPMGDGDFILPTNAELRKHLKKMQGAQVLVQLEEDFDVLKLSQDLVDCLADNKNAFEYFYNLPPSHINYYSNWINTAKSEHIIAKRIAVVINACINKWTFQEMLKQYKLNKGI